MSAIKVTLIGLTGGVGSGKSKLAQHWRESGITVVDLDQVGRELTDSDAELQTEIEKLAGTSLRAPGRGLDRRKLREVIFADPGKRAALERLLHPRILLRFQEDIQKAVGRGARLVICEAALLVDSGHYKEMDELVVVTAPEALRVQRVVERDHTTPVLAKQILQAQLPDETRLKHAHHVIKNDGTLEQLYAQADRLVAGWKKKNWL